MITRAIAAVALASAITWTAEHLGMVAAMIAYCVVDLVIEEASFR